MGDNIANLQDTVDLEINEDPYRHVITPGNDAAFLRALCDSLDVGLSILDEDLNYRFITRSVFRDLGMTEGDFSVGDNLSKCHEIMMAKGLLTPELLEQNKLTAEDQRRRNKSKSENLPTILKLGDGSTHKFIRKPLSNGYTVSMSHDISELVEKDTMLENALKLGKSGYWIYDFKTKTHNFNQAYLNYLSEEDRAALLKHGPMAVINPEDRHIFRKALKTTPSTNNTFEVSCRVLSYDNKQHWSWIAGEIVRDHEGKPSKIRAFLKDITRERHQARELERAKDDAIAASHAKSEFLANMSHEIRTPMNGILGMAELLANSDIDERQRDFVNVINNSASALLTIINDILDFSKIEAGAFEIDPMPFNLKDAINDVVSMLTAHANDKGLELIINYPSQMETGFIGDSGRLRQILTNLIGNAIKFTEKGHIITDIDVTEPRNDIAYVTMNITDTGIGIEAEKLKQVFKKFTQADGSTTRVYGGTGLGLSISKAIIEMMNGRITARSVLGKGSTFSVKIPLKLNPNADIKNYDTSALKGKHALIIDDIEVNRSLFTEQLTNWGITSDSVTNGVEAIAQLQNKMAEGQPYDLILLDFLMPGMNGHELARMITHTPSLCDIPIIMLSSCDQPISSQKLKEIGIESYLVKPAREARLYDAIVQVLTPTEHKASEISGTKERTEMPSTSDPLSKTEILVAEDFALNQDVVSLMLADTHYKPVFVNNGVEAVKVYKADPGRFPVILMDVSMPVMDGHEATALIQKYESQHDIMPTPIIALTGHAQKNDRDECLKAGMCDFLSKPVKQSELLRVLDLWVDANMDNQHALSA